MTLSELLAAAALLAGILGGQLIPRPSFFQLDNTVLQNDWIWARSIGRATDFPAAPNGGYLRAAAAPRASAVSQSPPRKLITQRDFAPALQLLRRGRLAAAAPGPGRRVAELGSRAPRETAC